MRTPAPNKPTGDHPIVKYCATERQRITERTPLKGDNYDVEERSDGWRLKIKIPVVSTPTGLPEEFAIVREYDDYVVGQRFTPDLNTDPQGRAGTLEELETRIAKPFELRASAFDLISRGGAGIAQINGYLYDFDDDTPGLRQVTLVDGEEFGALQVTWQEEITPAYLWDPVPTVAPERPRIYATKIKTGAIMTVTEDGGEFDIEYLDLNSACRRWEPIQRKIRVCVEGQAGAWFILIRASDSFQEE